jgi:hypothetical protein
MRFLGLPSRSPGPGGRGRGLYSAVTPRRRYGRTTRYRLTSIGPLRSNSIKYRVRKNDPDRVVSVAIGGPIPCHRRAEARRETIHEFIAPCPLKILQNIPCSQQNLEPVAGIFRTIVSPLRRFSSADQRRRFEAS